MKRIPLFVLLGLAIGLAVPSLAAAAEITQIVAGDSFAHLTGKELERARKHKGGISTHPVMMTSFFPFRWNPVSYLPVATFLEELTANGAFDEVTRRYDKEKVGLVLTEIFNIQLVSPRRNIDLPDSATLHILLTHTGKTVELEVQMHLQDGAYFISYPTIHMQDLADARQAVTEGKLTGPSFTLSHMSGFVFNEETIENIQPLGTPLIYNVRFGSVRISTGFQFAGRPLGVYGAEKEGFFR